MRIIIRYFFRALRLVLTPFMLLSEKLSTPKGITRSEEQQARVDEASKNLALYQFKACLVNTRSEEHTSELQSRPHLVCRLLLEKKKNNTNTHEYHRRLCLACLT